MTSLEIAKIVKPQGIRGQVKAQVFTNVNAALKALKIVYVEGKEYQVEALSFRQGFLYLNLKGISTRNDAEILRNKIISIDKQILKENLYSDEILVDDLIGLVLYDTDGKLVGLIVDVENFGATYNFLIESEGRIIQAPFVEGVFIKEGNNLVVNRKHFEEVSV